MSTHALPIFTYETEDGFTVGLDESGYILTVTKPDGATAIETHSLNFERVIDSFWRVKREQEYHAKFGSQYPPDLMQERNELKQRVEDLEQRLGIYQGE